MHTRLYGRQALVLDGAHTIQALAQTTAAAIRGFRPPHRSHCQHYNSSDQRCESHVICTSRLGAGGAQRTHIVLLRRIGENAGWCVLGELFHGVHPSSASALILRACPASLAIGPFLKAQYACRPKMHACFGTCVQTSCPRFGVLT